MSDNMMSGASNPNEHPLAGRAIRTKRQESGKSLSQLARDLRVSPAYLSLIETGKRPVSFEFLARAAERLNTSVETLMAAVGDEHLDGALTELMKEPLFRTLDVTEKDLVRLGSEPRVATTLTALYNLYKSTRRQLEQVLVDMVRNEREDASRTKVTGSATSFEAKQRLSDDASTFRFDFTPFDEVATVLEQQKNYFPELESRADKLRAEHGLGDRPNLEGLIVLAKSLGLDVQISPAPQRGSSVIRRIDRKKKSVTLSPDLPRHRQAFQLANVIALHIFDSEVLADNIANKVGISSPDTRTLLRVHLANYFAGAMLLPYDAFFEEVTRSRYDIERVAHLFEQSYETVAHRVCNLSAPHKKGIPFHFVRVDIAGNISKRYAATGLRFPFGAGSCPKWAVHTAFLTPHAIQRQYSVFPNGTVYFCFAKVLAEPIRGSITRGTVYALGLGTYAEFAKDLAYADELPYTDSLVIPVGTTCRLCERTDCNQRAAPSYKFALRFDEYVKKDNFFSPLMTDDEQD